VVVNWVRLPDDGYPRWFNLDHAHNLRIYWTGDLHGPRTCLVTAEYSQNRSVTLYRADTEEEALDWIETLLGGT
jgi:hypothetical protein